VTRATARSGRSRTRTVRSRDAAGSMRAIGAANTRCSIGSAWSRRSSPRHIAACNAETTSIHSSGGATISIPRKRAKPTGVPEAATATLASTTSHRPLRDSATAATQFGAGVPSSRRSHSGGMGSIGYSSSRTPSRSTGSITRRPPSVCAGRRPSRIQRRTSRRCVRPCSRLRRPSACCDRTPSTGGVQDAAIRRQEAGHCRGMAGHGDASGARHTFTGMPARDEPCPCGSA
jgi:hypothetical protein